MGGGVGRRGETEAEMVNGTNKQINKKRRKEKKEGWKSRDFTTVDNS